MSHSRLTVNWTQLEFWWNFGQNTKFLVQKMHSEKLICGMYAYSISLKIVNRIFVTATLLVLKPEYYAEIYAIRVMPGSLRRKNINNIEIEYEGWTVPCLRLGRVSISFVISVKRTCKYILYFRINFIMICVNALTDTSWIWKDVACANAIGHCKG